MGEIPQDEMRNHSWKEHQRGTPRDSTIKQTDTHNILDESPEHHVERKKKKKKKSISKDFMLYVLTWQNSRNGEDMRVGASS